MKSLKSSMECTCWQTLLSTKIEHTSNCFVVA